MIEYIPAIALFLFGACIGSFVNVLALRFISGEDTISKRSHCPHCERTLSWYELVPIISFIGLMGRCRTCRKPIAWQYPLVEIVMATSSVLILLPALTASSSTIAGIVLFIVTAILVVLTIIDSKTLLLPDMFVAALTVLSVTYLVLHQAVWPMHILAAVTGIIFLGGIWLITRGRGIGLGDVKIIVPLGLLVGYPAIFVLLLVAFVAGGVWGIYLLATKQATPKTAVPFGPFLIGAALLMVWWPGIAEYVIYTLIGWPAPY